MSGIYVSVDIEADGPIPGTYSMLSFGAAAFDLDGEDPPTPLATFTANLEQLPGAETDPSTMAWWATQPVAWAAHRTDTVDPVSAMVRFKSWLRALPGNPVLVGYPCTYDFMFVYWYLVSFGLDPGEKSPFGFQGLDIKTLAWAKRGGDFRSTTKQKMPKSWFTGAPKHDHTALQDAIGQGVLFVNMVRS